MSLSSLDEVTAIAVSWSVQLWEEAMGFFESCWTLQKRSVHGGPGSVVYCYIGSITSIWKVVYWHICFQLMLQLWSHSTSITICISVGSYMIISYPEDIDVFHVFLLSLLFYNFISWQIGPVGLPRFLWILYCRCWAFKMTQGHFWRCLEKRWRGWPCSFPVNEGFSRCSQIKVCKEGTGIKDVCILICANEKHSDKQMSCFWSRQESPRITGYPSSNTHVEEDCVDQVAVQQKQRRDDQFSHSVGLVGLQ